jgi:hypothetical protein
MPIRRPQRFWGLLLTIIFVCGCETLGSSPGTQPARVFVIQSSKADYRQVKECLEKALDEKRSSNDASLLAGMARAKELVVRSLNPSSKNSLSEETIYQFLADRLKDSPPYPVLYTARDLAVLEARGRTDQSAFSAASGNLAPEPYVTALLNPDQIKIALESMLADWGETAFVVDDALVRHVSYFAKFFAFCDREETNRAIARSRKYLPRVCEVFSHYALHEDIAFAVPFVESRFTTAACSTAGALGMFQFLASTARDYGLRVASDASGANAAVDERLDWEKTAPAAARYLVRSRNVFASNVLALGAYHHGSMKVVEVLLSIAEKSKERSFRYIFENDRLDAFSREYIPQCLAAAYLYRWLKHARLEVLPVVEAVYVSIKEPLPMVQLTSRFGQVQELNPDLAGTDRLYCYASTGGYALVTKTGGQETAACITRGPVANEHPVVQVPQPVDSAGHEQSQANSTAEETSANIENRSARIDSLTQHPALRTQDPGPSTQDSSLSPHHYFLIYTFQKGNSLTALAKTFGVDLRTILSHPANHRHNQRYPLQPRPGDTLVIPGLPPSTTLLSSQQHSPVSEYRFHTSENQTLRQISEGISDVLDSLAEEAASEPKHFQPISPELILYWNRDLLPPGIGMDDSLPPGIPLFIAAEFGS